MLRSAMAKMLPPRPPSPPSGPPRGTYFSRRNEALPSPPLPAITSIFASSKNFMSPPRSRNEKAPSGDGALSGSEEPLGIHRLDRHGALLVGSVGGVLHLARDQREERVVLAGADVGARVKLRAALAHEDGARVDELAAVHLDAE